MPSPVIQGTRLLSSLNGSVALTSGTAPAQVCQRLLIVVTTAVTSFTVTTLDGTATNLGALPAGVWQFDIQFTLAAWVGGAATAVGFYAIEG